MIFQEAHRYLTDKSEELDNEGLNVVDYLMMQTSEDEVDKDSMMIWALEITQQNIFMSALMGVDAEEAMAVALLRGVWIGYVAGKELHKEEYGR
jgi:hypothetical protein